MAFETCGKSYLLTKQSTNTIHLRSFEALYRFVDGLGAVKTREEIYAHHFMREKKISAQRLANCDNANLKRQVTKYEYHKKLFETGDLTKLTDVEFSTLKLRAEHPEFSYGDIAEKLGVSKSKVARTLRKIEEKLSG